MASRRCECRRKESLQWERAESEGHGNALCRAHVVRAERFCTAQGTRARGAVLRRRPEKVSPPGEGGESRWYLLLGERARIRRT